MSNLQVLFRVRPLVGKERDFAWNIDENNIELLPSFQDKMKGDQRQNFTRIFGETSTNEQVFQESIEPLVGRLIEGYNCTVIAYGQSSAGKTSTMFKGPGDQKGLTFLIVREIFKLTQGTTFRVKVQFVEIYNEVMVDLLAADKRQPVMREENSYIYLQNVTEPVINSEEDLHRLIQQGTTRRTTSDTALNEVSSRSHAVIRLVLEQGDVLNLPTKKGFKVTKQAAFTLVDLAGSEKIQKTNAQGQRLKESTAINQSLLTLGLVINQLATKQSYISYRDSKLTRLLQNSLGGNAITFMVGCISPCAEHIEESLNTMRFCQRAMHVSNKVKAIDAVTDQKVKQEQLMVQNRNLKLRITELEQQLQISQSQCVNSSNISTIDTDINFDEISLLLELDQKEVAAVQTDVTHVQVDPAGIERKEIQLKQLKSLLGDFETQANKAAQDKENLQRRIEDYERQKQRDIEALKAEQRAELESIELRIQELTCIPDTHPVETQTSILSRSFGASPLSPGMAPLADRELQTSRLDASRGVQVSPAVQLTRSVLAKRETAQLEAQTSAILQNDISAQAAQAGISMYMQTSQMAAANKSVAGLQNTMAAQQTSTVSRRDLAVSAACKASMHSCGAGQEVRSLAVQKSAAPLGLSAGADAPLSQDDLASTASLTTPEEVRPTTPIERQRVLVCSASLKIHDGTVSPRLSPIKQKSKAAEADVIQQQLLLRRVESASVKQSPLKTVHYQQSSDSEQSASAPFREAGLSFQATAVQSSTVSFKDESETLSALTASVGGVLDSKEILGQKGVSFGAQASQLVNKGTSFGAQASPGNRSVGLGQTRVEGHTVLIQAQQDWSEHAVGRTLVPELHAGLQTSVAFAEHNVGRTQIVDESEGIQASYHDETRAVQAQISALNVSVQLEAPGVADVEVLAAMGTTSVGTSFGGMCYLVEEAVLTDSQTLDIGIQACPQRAACQDVGIAPFAAVEATCQTLEEDWNAELAQLNASDILDRVRPQGPLLEGIMMALMEQRAMFSKQELLLLADRLETAALATNRTDYSRDEAVALRDELGRQIELNTALQEQLKQEQFAVRAVTESNTQIQDQLKRQLDTVTNALHISEQKNAQLRRSTDELQQQIKCLQDANDELEAVQKSMQTSFNAADLQEATMRLIQENAAPGGDDYRLLYIESQARFEQLKTASREMIAGLLKKARDREEFLNQRAAQEIAGLKKYKEMVLRSQARAAGGGGGGSSQSFSQ